METGSLTGPWEWTVAHKSSVTIESPSPLPSQDAAKAQSVWQERERALTLHIREGFLEETAELTVKE